MRKCGAWSHFSGNDAVAVWKQMGSPLNLGHANILLMTKSGIYRWLTSCGWGVGASQRRPNSHEASYRYHEITLLSNRGMQAN
jgi:hypothetical protein